MTFPRRSCRASRPTRFRPTLDRLEGRALMAVAGTLDTSFGAGVGAFTLPATSPSSTTPGLGNLLQIQVEPDGSIVAAGTVYGESSPAIGVIHLSASGVLDTSFGTGGLAQVVDPANVPFGPSFQLFVQSNGQILVFGGQTGGSTLPAFVERLNANGTPDTTFGTDGRVTFNQATVGIPGAVFSRATLQANDQLVIVGYSPISSATDSPDQVTVARLTTTGALDSTFGTGGVVTVPANSSPTPPSSNAETVAIQPNGQIVVAGIFDVPLVGVSTSPYTPELIRLNADGSQDTTLGQAGIVASGIQVPYAMTVEPDGNLVVFGTTKYESVYPIPYSGITLVSPTGTLLTSASEYGTVADAPNTAQVVATANGDVVVSDGLNSFSAIRLTPSLHPDTTFGVNNSGFASVKVPLSALPPGSSVTSSGSDGLTVAPNGQILLVGGVTLGSGANSQGYIAMVRLTATATSATQGDFNGDGISDIALYLPNYGSFAITDSSGETSGKIVPFGIAGPGQTFPAPGDYYGTGQEDIAAYLPTLGVYAIQDPTGKTSGIDIPFGTAGMDQTIPAPGDYYHTGQTDIAVYLTQSGVFAIQDPTGKTSGKLLPFGVPGTGQSIPVPGDYDGTGQTDIAVYLAQSGVWAIQDPTGKTSGKLIPFGMPGLGNSIPVPGDYDGSGKTELAVYIPSLTVVIYRPANGGPDVTIPFGTPGIGDTLPAPGDYDGSGRTEVAAYLPNLGIFAYRPALGGSDVYQSIGVPGAGQTIPVTTVVLSPFPGTRSTPGFADAIQATSILGEPDTLDFLPSVSAKKSKPGDPPAGV